MRRIEIGVTSQVGPDRLIDDIRLGHRKIEFAIGLFRSAKQAHFIGQRMRVGNDWDLGSIIDRCS